jgi:tryptophanyl-tRNA synthetase
MRRRTLDMAADILACGVDPAKCTLFVQSHVPEHTELSWVLNTVAGFGELGRMTQFKDKSERQADNINVGLFTYPVLQTADILIYRAKYVPVGQDQLQHLELAREIARRFNTRWKDYFPEPQALLSTTPKILGLDGAGKMSKSMGNTISLGEDDASITGKLKTAATDPARVKRTDAGDPDKCNINTLHTFFSDAETLAWVREGCTTAGIGCIQCKTRLTAGVIAHLDPIRERKRELMARPAQVEEILREGGKKARAVAQETMREVREIIGLWV